MRIIFSPCDPVNPYQKLLIQKLRGLGVEVVEILYPSWKLLLKLFFRKPDILHLHWLHPFFLDSSFLRSSIRSLWFVLSLLILKMLGVKIVWTAHNLQNHERRQLQVDRTLTFLVTRLADAIITHCETAKQELLSMFQTSRPQKVAVIPQGHYGGYYKNKISRNEARRILNVPESGLVFLFFGSIRRYKGLPELIRAFIRLNNPHAYLIIAGWLSADVAEEIRNQVKGMDRIRFLPRLIADDEIQLLMNASDAVVLPYRDILTSAAVVLAMSFGKPCIAVRKGCLEETLDGRGAFLYSPDSEDGLFQSLTEAQQKRDSLSQMGMHNLSRAQAWGWDSAARMTHRIYQQCLNAAS